MCWFLSSTSPTAPTRPALSYFGSSLAFQVPHVAPPLLQFSIFTPLGTLTPQQPRPGAQTCTAGDKSWLQHNQSFYNMMKWYYQEVGWVRVDGDGDRWSPQLCWQRDIACSSVPDLPSLTLFAKLGRAKSCPSVRKHCRCSG